MCARSRSAWSKEPKRRDFVPHGVEGQQDSDWVLIDLNEMIVHVMLPRVREFYGLEKLWDITATKRAARAVIAPHAA